MGRAALTVWSAPKVLEDTAVPGVCNWSKHKGPGRIAKLT